MQFNPFRDASIAATLFTTANFAMRYPMISGFCRYTRNCLPYFYHSVFEEAHLPGIKNKLQEITGKNYRTSYAADAEVSVTAVQKAGYTYDSSINPTYLPGRYNNFHLPRTIYTEENLTHIPASVSPSSGYRFLVEF